VKALVYFLILLSISTEVDAWATIVTPSAATEDDLPAPCEGDFVPISLRYRPALFPKLDAAPAVGPLFSLADWPQTMPAGSWAPEAWVMIAPEPHALLYELASLQC
jgi:hypothetical protein